jgi:hypothetical protein
MERENERIDLGFALFFVFRFGRRESERRLGVGDPRERAGAPLDASVGGGELRPRIDRLFPKTPGNTRDEASCNFFACLAFVVEASPD